MTLTEPEIALLTRSLERLTDRPSGSDPFGQRFYLLLFEEAPETRALFREDFSEQGMRFLSTLRVIVEALNRPEALADHMARLGAGHAAYGVRAEHFAPMERALRRCMAEALGDKYDAETDAAWQRAYAEISRWMQDEAAAPGSAQARS